MYIGKAMSSIEIVVCGVVDGRSADSWSPSGIFTGDEQHVAQVTRVGHGVFLVGQRLMDEVAKLGNAGHRHAA